MAKNPYAEQYRVLGRKAPKGLSRTTTPTITTTASTDARLRKGAVQLREEVRFRTGWPSFYQLLLRTPRDRGGSLFFTVA